ncbi:MAG: pantothenate kinase [Snowella sp.]|nr:pantothenate kinase [Snowella sp.]
MEASPEWLALMIGNSHLHWSYFEQNILIKTWQTNHDSITNFPENILLYLASVVPKQTEFFLEYPALKLIQLTDIPLKKLYPTLGIDRALAVLGSGETYGFPSLVIDGGTALTFTGVNQDRELIGGAILPGLGLQFQSLSVKTAALPRLHLPQSLPNRWAINTEDAIASGILYTLLTGITSFIEDWLKQFPNSKIIFTGGDGARLLSYLNEIYPDIANDCKFDPNLIFWGMRSLKNR